MSKFVITVNDLVKWIKEGAKFEDLEKLPVKCENCGFRDLLGKFLDRASWEIDDTVYVNIGNSTIKFKKYLRCPKCTSSFVGIDTKDLPDYISVMI